MYRKLFSKYLVWKQWFNTVEKFDLLSYAVTTSFGNVNDVQDSGAQVSQRSYGLHFDNISLF